MKTNDTKWSACPRCQSVWRQDAYLRCPACAARAGKPIALWRGYSQPLDQPHREHI